MVITTHFTPDKYTDFVIQSFDLNVINETYTSSIPEVNLDELNSFDWQVGLIVGNSGSGKTTILKKLHYTPDILYSTSKPIISHFPKLSPQEASELLLGVGLCSIPTWLQTPNTLSMGEFARFEIAMRLYNALLSNDHTALIDEFTSTVNRLCAQSIANALRQFLVKHKDLKVIIATCHFDIVEFLHPDWIINMNKSDSCNKVEINKLTYFQDTLNVNPELVLTSIYEIL